MKRLVPDKGRWIAAAAATVMLLAAGCTGTEGQSSGTSSTGRVAFLNYGGFGGGTNPQANYNPYLTTDMLQAVFYVYEPLITLDNYSCTEVPWLSTGYRWTDPKTLVWTLRDGVKFTDGKPFTADDVTFTFDLLKKNKAFDVTGIWSHLDAVTATDAKTVTMTFKEPGAFTLPLFQRILIVPKHIWSAVADPVKFPNAENPIGTGPFTVKAFNPQQLTIARNPNYWQADKVNVEEIRFHTPNSSGDVDQLKLSRGEYDTNAMFVQDIKKTYVDRDPEHNHYWYPPGGAVSLAMNLTKAPFNDVAFRKALTTAFDKKQIVEKAQLGYVKEASQTGMVVPGQADLVPADIPDQGLIGFDPAKADAALTAAGYAKNAEGKRLGKDGKPMKFKFAVPGSFDDWVAAARIMVANLTALGITVEQQKPDPTTYYNDLGIGSFDTAIDVIGNSCNTYDNFLNLLATSKTKPIGEKTETNRIRYQDPATDQILAQIAAATDENQKKALIGQIAKVMYDQVPMVAVWYGAVWYQYNTKRATGWPNEKDPYGMPSDNLLIVTHLKPAS